VIRQINIKNFKSISELALDLGRTTVLVGENGSWKSDILEAVAMGAAGESRELGNKALVARGIGSASPALMRAGFEKGAEEKDILIEIKGDGGFGANIRLTCGNRPFATWKRQPVYLESNVFADFLIFAPENCFRRQFEEDISVLGIRGEGLFKLLAIIAQESPEQLQTIKAHLNELPGWFDDLEISDDLYATERRIRDRYLNDTLNDTLNSFDQRSANEGFLYLLFYFTLFVSDYTPKFFAIDNIDNAMNPRLCAEPMRVLMKLARAHDKQVIFTTPNPSILGGLDLADDGQRLLVVSRNLEGNTQVRRIFPDKPIPGQLPVRVCAKIKILIEKGINNSETRAGIQPEIIFAIAVGASECRLLPLHIDNARTAKGTANRIRKLTDKGVVLDKNRVRTYDGASEDLRKHKLLQAAAEQQPSLALLWDQLCEKIPLNEEEKAVQAAFSPLQLHDLEVVVGIDADIGGDGEAFLHDLARCEVGGVLFEGDGGGFGVHRAGANGHNLVFGGEHVAISGNHQPFFFVHDHEHGLQVAQVFVAAPCFGKLHGGTAQVAVHVEFFLKAL